MRTGSVRGVGFAAIALRRAMSLSGVALVGVVLAGCATAENHSSLSTGAVPPSASAVPSVPAATMAETNAPVASGKARLLLSRPGGMLYAAVPARVKVGDDQVASLWAGNTAVVDVPAGTTRISVDSWNYPGEWADDISLGAGQTYRVEVGAREDGIGTAVMFGAIGGAFEASSNATRSGLFQLKVETEPSPTRTASAAQPAASSGR
jgi:hypothetical protein